MDITIKAGPRGGKTVIAPKIADLFKGKVAEIRVEFMPLVFNQSHVKHAVIEANADVVILDQCFDWFLQHAQQAVKDARIALDRDIVAIYCVQDENAVQFSEQPDRIKGIKAMPLSLVDEQRERLKDKIVYCVNNGDPNEVREALEKFGAMRLGLLDPVNYTAFEIELDKIVDKLHDKKKQLKKGTGARRLFPFVLTENCGRH